MRATFTRNSYVIGVTLKGHLYQELLYYRVTVKSHLYQEPLYFRVTAEGHFYWRVLCLRITTKDGFYQGLGSFWLAVKGHLLCYTISVMVPHAA